MLWFATLSFILSLIQLLIYHTFAKFQFTLNVRDAGSPLQTSAIPVTINVIRDLRDPVFTSNYYVVPVSYLANTNDFLVNTTATDSDTDVSILLLRRILNISAFTFLTVWMTCNFFCVCVCVCVCVFYEVCEWNLVFYSLDNQGFCFVYLMVREEWKGTWTTNARIKVE